MATAIVDASPSSTKLASSTKRGISGPSTPAPSGGDLGFGMTAGTSPAATSLPSNQLEISFQANTGNLWTINPNVSGGDQNLGMMKGTSPAITITFTGTVEGRTGTVVIVGSSNGIGLR